MIEFLAANIAGVIVMLVVIGSCIVPLLWNKFKN